MKRLLGLIAFLTLVFPMAFASAQSIPTDEQGFTDHVAGLLRKEVGDAQVAVKGPLTISLAGLQANLDRVFQFCRTNAAGCAAEVDRYVKGAAQVLKDRSAPPTKSAVRLVIRTAAYVQAGLASSPDIQPRPFVEGLVMLPVLDSPRTIRMLTERDNKALGLTADEVFKLGQANLDSQLKPLMEVAKPAARGQIGYLTDDPYHHARLINHASWAPLAQAQGGSLVVALPATDTVLYVGETTPIAIDALRALALDMRKRTPRPLSDILLKWTPGGWEVVR